MMSKFEAQALHPVEGFGIDTQLVTLGRSPELFNGFVNTPVYHGSTVLSSTVKELLGRTQPYIYARRGTPTSAALEQAICGLEGGAGAVLCPSGLSACTTALLSCLKTGDHLLVSDGVFGPVRHACETVLSARFGVEVTYYDPMAGADIALLIKSNTRAVYVEAPSSHTFEVQDVRAIADVAHQHGMMVLADNTWASPLFFQPHAHGVDLSIQAGTKYLVGHSDAMLGTVSASAAAWPALKALHGDLGLCVGPDDIYLALRGLRTLGMRMRTHQENALVIAGWLKSRPEVRRVLHPAFDDCPGHVNWQRYFKGSSGLFSVELQDFSQEAVEAFLDGLSLFGLGYSWGGFESLALPFDVSAIRTATRWQAAGPCIRFHIGLESVADLIADLEAGLDRLVATDVRRRA
ncbi:cystathionine beta-lyase [Undibacterium sp. Ji83W]|uniref:cystathionine beta-lyase n=1 Tax=Undibacterium sp. Ji83W TaxID=3413043 RepID=UPI003BEF5AD6